MKTIFGSLYDEWFRFGAFDNVAQRLASRFLDSEAGVTYKNRYAFADVDLSDFLSTEKSSGWVPYDDLPGVTFEQIFASPVKSDKVTGFYSKPGITGTAFLRYAVPDFKSSLLEDGETKTFNGVEIRKTNGTLEFNLDNLRWLGIIQ